MRTIGIIADEILKNEQNEEKRMRIKELCNACGSQATEIKDEILSAAKAEAITFNDMEEEYISISALESIVLTAGCRLC